MRALTDKKKTILLLITQAIILIITVVTAAIGFFYGAGSSQDGDNTIGWGYFQPFTMDCNVLAGICALVLVCFAVRSLLKREYTTPVWAVIFQFVTADCLLLTFVTVLFFLAPIDALSGLSFFGMFSDDLFFFHLVNPLLSIGSFVFLQGGCQLKRKDCLWGLLPVAVYVLIYFLMVVVFRTWSDFYGFSFGGRYYLVPAVIIVIFLLTYVLARLLRRMNSRVSGRTAG